MSSHSCALPAWQIADCSAAVGTIATATTLRFMPNDSTLRKTYRLRHDVGTDENGVHGVFAICRSRCPCIVLTCSRSTSTRPCWQGCLHRGVHCPKRIGRAAQHPASPPLRNGQSVLSDAASDRQLSSTEKHGETCLTPVDRKGSSSSQRKRTPRPAAEKNARKPRQNASCPTVSGYNPP